MTDIHSHIIYDVDDGSKTVEESIALLNELKAAGFDNVIATPHYIENNRYKYCSDNKEKSSKLNIIKKELKKQNIDINVYIGNEIFISDTIIENIKKNKIATLNNSKYFLFEIPFHNKIINLHDIVYEFKIAGYSPILAHPERYDYFQNNHKLIDELKEEGLLFQCNYSSILGYYGPKAKRLMKYLLKKQYVDYLGTDIHHINRDYVIENFDKITKKILKITKEDYYNQIITNGDNLIK